MIAAEFSQEPVLEIRDSSRFDPMDFGAIADGQSHPDANGVEQDSIALQAALDAAKDCLCDTLPGSGDRIPRTGVSRCPVVVPSPGRYVLNWPAMVWPHIPIRGSDWGHSQLTLAKSGWHPKAPRLTANPQAIMWGGNITNLSALLWLQGDVEYPEASQLFVAGMKNSISHLDFTCHSGPAIFIGSNQNQISIHHNSIMGWGDGPTGLGIVANNPTSSTQITNAFIFRNQIEGCVAAIVADRVCGSIDHNQIESCGNGIYVGSGKSIRIDENILTCDIPTKPFENGIWLGCGLHASISSNTITDVTKNGIKLLGRHTTIANNDIAMKSAWSIKDPGYGILVVGPSKQFGGNMQSLGGKHGVHQIIGNNIECDVWPAARPNPIFVDQAPGEQIFSYIANNVTAPP